MKITVKKLLSWKPCADYPKERIKALGGRGLTPLQVLDLDIPAPDRLWVVLREDIIPEKELRLLAADFAEAALPMFEAKEPDDSRPRRAIDAARAYARGEITDPDLSAACAAALSAFWHAANNSARSAAWAAAVVAARDDAQTTAREAASTAARAYVWTAARTAARAAAEQREAQIAMVRSVLLRLEKH